jgi:hypothetical protein
MNNKIVYALIIAALIAFWAGFIWLGFHFAPTERTLDCRMAEFHPDYTAEMRQACRDRMRHKL